MRRLVAPSTVAFVTASLLTGCAPATPEPELLTDPRLIVARSVGAAAHLRTLHLSAEVVVRVQAQPPDPLAPPPGGSLVADLDLATQELSASGASNDGSGRFSMIIADGSTFVLMTETGRWQQVPGGMAGIGAMVLMGGQAGAPVQVPDVEAILVAGVGDATIDARLIGIVDCAGGRCYRVGLDIPPGALWGVIAKAMQFDQLAPDLGPLAMQAPPGFPSMTTELLVDTRTARPLELRAAFRIDRNDANLTVRFGPFDGALDIQPPQPALIDQQPLGGFGSKGRRALSDTLAASIATASPKEPR